MFEKSSTQAGWTDLGAHTEFMPQCDQAIQPPRASLVPILGHQDRCNECGLTAGAWRRSFAPWRPTGMH